MTQIFDLSNPARPVFIRNFGLPGQQPGASGPVPTELHGPISAWPARNRVYFGYGVNRAGILQIVDRAKLLGGAREPTERNLLAPQVGRFDLPASNGAHTTLPILGMELAKSARDKIGGKRDFVFVVNESVAGECREERQKAWMVELTGDARAAARF